MARPGNACIILAFLVVASINPGTLSYIVALVVVVGFLLSTILSPFKPGSVVKTLNESAERTYIDYNEHKDKLEEKAGFGDKVDRLRLEAFKLKEKHLIAHENMSLTDLRSWGHYMLEAKDIWVKARQYQREIVELRKVLKLAIVRALRDELEAALGHHGQEREETTRTDKLDGTSII